MGDDKALEAARRIIAYWEQRGIREPMPGRMSPASMDELRCALAYLSLHEEAGRLRGEREWRSLDSAPKDGTEVLLRCAAGADLHGNIYYSHCVARWGRVYPGWELTRTGGWAEDADVEGEPVEWMPLPALR